MRASKVVPNHLETLPEDLEEADVPPVRVVGSGSKTIKVSSMFSALLQRPAKGGSSPVLKFGKSTVLVSLGQDDDEHCSPSKPASAKDGSKASKALLPMGGAPGARPSKAKVVRRLFRQEHSMPGRESAREATPLRRCISAGGCATTIAASSNNHGSNSTKLNRPEASNATASASSTRPAACSSASYGGRHDSSSSSSSNGYSLAEAVQNLAQAASATASVLSSARQQHEEALLRQREQFQLALQSMRARSATPLSPGEASAAPASEPASGGAAATGAYWLLRQQQQQQQQQQSPLAAPPAPPTSATEIYRGVQFSIPLGCRIEDGEGPSEVLVTGPAIDVVLEFRDGGRNVLLVSSNCVCTVKRMGGRVLVNVLPRLEVRSA